MHSTGATGFFQQPPIIGNQYVEDSVLQRTLRLFAPSQVCEKAEKCLIEMGDVAISQEMAVAAQDAEDNPPRVKHYDGWGIRTDQLQCSWGWRKLKEIAVRQQLLSHHEYGQASRIIMFAKYYLYCPSSAVYSCPLAMTDGAARVLMQYGTEELKRDVVPRLTTIEWTSGQWMTERSGGSDVSGTETVAYPQTDGSYTLRGFKWFSSATDSDMAVVLACIPATSGLSLFYVPVRLPDGNLNGIRIQALKTKLGTRAVPTAELELVDVKGCVLLGEMGRGVAAISTVLNITRIHNAVSAVSFARRAYAIATAFAKVRTVGGKRLMENALHVHTLAQVAIGLRANILLAFHTVALLGCSEEGRYRTYYPLLRHHEVLLRTLAPVVKAYTAKFSIAAISECIEALGGQGYIENATILPRLLRDAQVLSIWEGTTNVLATDLLRVLQKDSKSIQCLDELIETAPNIDNLVKKNLNSEWTRTQTMVRSPLSQLAARDVLFSIARLVASTLLLHDAAKDGNQISLLCAKRFILDDNDKLLPYATVSEDFAIVFDDIQSRL